MKGSGLGVGLLRSASMGCYGSSSVGRVRDLVAGQLTPKLAGQLPAVHGCRRSATGVGHGWPLYGGSHAVRVGGGQNQRLALWHGILIKENHIAAAGGIKPALAAAAALNAGVSVQIEVENLDELAEALDAGATSVLIDDFSLADMRRACALNAGRALLEVSGSVNLQTIRDIAATGVDRNSIGKLTKDVRAIDLSMRVRG